MTTDRFIPTRFKSIDLAEIEIAKLKHNTQNCEPMTPYKEKIKILNRETDRFK